MIQFPELDLKNTKVRVIIFFLAMLFLFLSNFNTNYLLSILVIILLINQYSDVKKNIDEHIIQIKDDIAVRYNNKIDDLLKQIKKFKKFNPQAYKMGIHYWKYFIKELTLLENDTLHNYNQHFDKAHGYLQKSANSLQSIGVAAREDKYIHSLEYHDFTNSKRLREISEATKQLYNEGFHLLYELSLRYNERWKENPTIHSKEIVMDYPLPQDREASKHYDFYL